MEQSLPRIHTQSSRLRPLVVTMIDRVPQTRSRRIEPPRLAPHNEVPRWTWILLIILFAAIIGGVAGLLSHAAGSNVPSAILTGGGAFAGTVGLSLAIAHYATAK